MCDLSNKRSYDNNNFPFELHSTGNKKVLVSRANNIAQDVGKEFLNTHKWMPDKGTGRLHEKYEKISLEPFIGCNIKLYRKYDTVQKIGTIEIKYENGTNDLKNLSLFSSPQIDPAADLKRTYPIPQHINLKLLKLEELDENIFELLDYWYRIKNPYAKTLRKVRDESHIVEDTSFLHDLTNEELERLVCFLKEHFRLNIEFTIHPKNGFNLMDILKVAEIIQENHTPVKILKDKGFLKK